MTIDLQAFHEVTRLKDGDIIDLFDHLATNQPIIVALVQNTCRMLAIEAHTPSLSANWKATNWFISIQHLAKKCRSILWLFSKCGLPVVAPVWLLYLRTK